MNNTRISEYTSAMAAAAEQVAQSRNQLQAAVNSITPFQEEMTPSEYNHLKEMRAELDNLETLLTKTRCAHYVVNDRNLR